MRKHGTSKRPARPEKISTKVYAVMAMTTALTFASLTTSYQLLFPPHAMIA
jgi:hypothetical protein